MKFPKRKSYFSPIVFLSVIVFINCSLGQNIKLEKLSVEDGLSNSYVNCLLQDRIGFIWFGTDDGLNRFDGYEIKVYRNSPDDSTSLSNNIIWSLYEDHSGYLWVGTKGGKLNRYDPYSDSFDHWYLDSNRTDEKHITYITEDKNNFIWIGTYQHGLYRFNQSQNKFDHWQNQPGNSNVLSSNYILSILQDDDGNILIATFNGLEKFNTDSEQKPFTQLFKDSSNQKDIFNIPIWYLGKSSFDKSVLWVGSLNGLVKFDPSKVEYSKVSLPESIELPFANSVSSVVEEDFAGENVLWIGTYGGLVRHNLSTGKMQRFVKNEKNLSGLISNQINDLIIDRSGVVWIATENGLNYYSPKHSKFNFLNPQANLFAEFPELQNRNIRAIAQTNDKTLWFGTDGKLFGIKDISGSSSLFHNTELQSLNTWCLYSGESTKLWIGTYGQGLKEFDLKSNKLKSWSIENPAYNPSAYKYVKTILQDTMGMVWVGFWGGGLARMNPGDGKNEYWRNELNNPTSLSYNDVWVLHQDLKGRIWIGTNGGGLDLFSAKAQNTFYHWKANKNDKQSLSSNNIYTIHESIKGNSSGAWTILWIGTANGLNKFVIKNDFDPHNYSDLNININYYTVDDGLPDNSVESILEDENGNLWIGTSSGISFFNVEEESFTNYNLADGLNGNTFNSSSALNTKDGIMFFGSTTGLNYFNPERIKQSTYSPPVRITGFQLFNQPVNLKNVSPLKKSIFHTKEIILCYNQNDFSFQFTSLDFNAPEVMKYAYKLEGFDKDWIYSGTRRFATYTNLDAGEYVFRVKATNSDGVWNEDGTALAIIIEPPFWMTWWAYTLYIITLLSILSSIRYTEIKRRKRKEDERLRREREAAQLREAKLKAVTVEQEKELEKQKIRNRIAQDLHDEIGSNLSSISLMSELIQKDGKINPEALEKINRIQKVAKGSSQAMRDIVWLTNPSSDSIKDLVSKMNEVANDMLGNMKWHFDFPKDLSEINLIPEIKRNVFFIYKESLNNILKHAKAKNVAIDLRVVDSKMFLTIKDDGNGFDTSTAFSGNGIKNLRSRAKEIKGDLRIESASESGTSINLLVNITHLRD